MKTTNPLDIARSAVKEQIQHHTSEVERLTKILEQLTDAVPPSFADFTPSSGGESSPAAPSRRRR
ncbi:MAG TPA: hypothetical protein VGB55_11670 [Tepidisphaeraceae bacterium]